MYRYSLVSVFCFRQFSVKQLKFERGTYICVHAWIFLKATVHINNSLYTNYENVFIELDS